MFFFRLGGLRFKTGQSRKWGAGMLSQEEIKARIQQKIPFSEVEVIDTVGDQNHWSVLVCSEAFEGKSLIDRHRMVMESVKDWIGDRMHAIEIKAITPNEG